MSHLRRSRCKGNELKDKESSQRRAVDFVALESSGADPSPSRMDCGRDWQYALRRFGMAGRGERLSRENALRWHGVGHIVWVFRLVLSRCAPSDCAQDDRVGEFFNAR